MIRALQRGVKIKALSKKTGMVEKTNMLRMLLSPKMFKIVFKSIKELSAIIKQTEISYSFIILDSSWTIIEVPHPTKNIFYLGFIFQNADIAKRLSGIFHDMWTKATELSLV